MSLKPNAVRTCSAGSSGRFCRIVKRQLPRKRRGTKKARSTNPNAKVNNHHANFLRKWWILSYAREDMIAALGKLPRYVVCGRVTKRTPSAQPAVSVELAVPEGRR
jgi:hypothetical protein